jgi:hypothetical protein
VCHAAASVGTKTPIFELVDLDDLHAAVAPGTYRLVLVPRKTSFPAMAVTLTADHVEEEPSAPVLEALKLKPDPWALFPTSRPAISP